MARVRRPRVFLQVFASTLTVSLASILVTGLIARAALSRAFDDYMIHIAGTTGMMPGRGMGRMVIGGAEQTFLSAVDRGIVVSALVAVVIAALAAYLVARSLSRPVGQLTAGARALAAGDLDHRVDAGGPEELEELAEAFNDMADSLEQAELLRRRLVSDVAHELRNPIAALRAQAEGVAEGVLPLDDARIASMVDDISHLSRLVDELQELSVAEAGRLRYELVDLDVCDLVRREVDRARAIVSDEVALRAECVPEAVSARCDEFRIAQVLRNLLANAARHTQAGEIVVSVAERDGVVNIAVRDTGSGIPPEDLPHIFERFYRADTARSSTTGGTGLGLAISRRIVEDHGGAMTAESAPGSGTTIAFTLPRVGGMER
ncbi:MAG: hypothetical protein Kow0067_13360 [Coriobacteriia bacterium]